MTDTLTAYEEFLHEKVHFTRTFGFDVDLDDIHPLLLGHQRALVQWGCKGGRRAYFADFGLGKSMIQLETIRLCLARTGGGKGLIVLPLGVRQEFKADAAKLGIDVLFVQDDSEIHGDGIYLTNYESVRLGKVTIAQFGATSLDEADVLRSYGSLTFQVFLQLFAEVPYRFVATATPEPNRDKELIHYAGFLGVMDTGQALTRFFQRNSEKAGDLTLYPNKEHEFYLWLNTWASLITKPSDLGFSDEGYELPELDLRFHLVNDGEREAPTDRDGQGVLVRGVGGVSTVEAAREKRASLQNRIDMVAALVSDQPEKHVIIWHDLEDERRAIKTALPEAVEVFGVLPMDEKENRVVDFAQGRSRILATKPSLSGAGCNFQRHCSWAIFAGVGFKFRDFIQAVHRIHRFLQTEQVRIDIVYTAAEQSTVDVLMAKWARHNETRQKMTQIVREFGLDTAQIEQALIRSMGVSRIEASGKGWLVANNDCVPETQSMAECSVDLIISSIPFGNQYEYSASYNDFGHTDDNDHFWAQMDFLTPEMLRVLKPGRFFACHVKDRILFGSVTGKGSGTVAPFHAEAIMHGLKHGFDYMGMITVGTDVVRENNQTYRLSYGKMLKDRTAMGVGSPEYILLFRKPQSDRTAGWADDRVQNNAEQYSLGEWQINAGGTWKSSGDRYLTPFELRELSIGDLSRLFTERTLKSVYNFESHVAIADELLGKGKLPKTFAALNPAYVQKGIWTDINRMLTLNTSQSQKNQAMHVCPLQFDVVDRLVHDLSNPGELVYDPFGGLFTVPLRAVKQGRRGRAAELATPYFLDGVGYLEAEERKQAMPTLFDLVTLEDQAAAS